MVTGATGGIGKVCKDMVSEAGRVSVVLLDSQIGFVIKRAIKNMRRIAHRCINDLRMGRRVLIGDVIGIEQIAESAGVARTTVYRRWSSKEALIAAAIADKRGAADERALSRAKSASAVIEDVISALVDTIVAPNYQKLVARLVGSVSDHPELMSTYWHSYLVPRREAVSEALESARSKGLIWAKIDSSGGDFQFVSDFCVSL